MKMFHSTLRISYAYSESIKETPSRKFNWKSKDGYNTDINSMDRWIHCMLVENCSQICQSSLLQPLLLSLMNFNISMDK